jgi:NAD(P)-dependent dehydrogenase (short-subunit alcohol dehydrogenase family)
MDCAHPAFLLGSASKKTIAKTGDSMSFQNAVAIVTGGASGIGRAICVALAQRGAMIVVVADLDLVRAQRVANAVSAGRAAQLDVTDADAVKALVEDTVKLHGRLDFLFNNAGIGILCEAQDVPLADWQRVLDVNLNGVVHGVAAAYPIMVRQGSGHIVNTASLAGLTASPWLVSYAASKFAVVGLSLSLRAEAAALGVRVSAVCPGFIQTPLFYNLEMHTDIDREHALASIMHIAMSPERCAKAILNGVARNRGLIVVTAHAKLLYWIQRISPWLGEKLAEFAVKRMRKRFGGGKGSGWG